ncbi:MAG: hypothetical protein ACOCZ8_06385 [Bacteroidota bacterium]
MATRLELEFDSAADALVFIRLAEMAKGVRIVEQASQNPPSEKAANPTQAIDYQRPYPPQPDSSSQSEQMQELDDMLPDWFK